MALQSRKGTSRCAAYSAGQFITFKQRKLSAGPSHFKDIIKGNVSCIVLLFEVFEKVNDAMRSGSGLAK